MLLRERMHVLDVAFHTVAICVTVLAPLITVRLYRRRVLDDELHRMRHLVDMTIDAERRTMTRVAIRIRTGAVPRMTDAEVALVWDSGTVTSGALGGIVACTAGAHRAHAVSSLPVGAVSDAEDGRPGLRTLILVVTVTHGALCELVGLPVTLETVLHLCHTRPSGRWAMSSRRVAIDTLEPSRTRCVSDTEPTRFLHRGNAESGVTLPAALVRYERIGTIASHHRRRNHMAYMTDRELSATEGTSVDVARDTLDPRMAGRKGVL